MAAAVEFRAYPQTSSTTKPNTFMKVQGVLHSTDSVALPCSLLLVGFLLVLYQHATDPDTGRHSMRNFLAKILISMVPLAIFERKILQCKDPVGLFAKCSVKVLLVHAFFLGLRLFCLIFPDVQVGYNFCNIIGFVAACIMLPAVFGFRLSKAALAEHLDMAGLAFCIFAIALLEVSLFGQYLVADQLTRELFIEDVIVTGSDYCEIVAFVPAVWMACREDCEAPQYGLADSQRRAACLFAFLTFFYLVEDIGNAVAHRKHFPLATCGHVAHFLLFLDFWAFLLVHLFDPSKFAKIRGAVLGWFSDACAV